jgi:DNA-binding transcriptional LysR family regulator
MREAALGGLGIALLPDFSAQRDIDEGHLVPLTACVRLPLASHTISARSMGSGVGFGACSI